MRQGISAGNLLLRSFPGRMVTFLNRDCTSPRAIRSGMYRSA